MVMLNIQNKMQDDSIIDYSLLSRELMQLRQENTLYRKAIAQITDVSDQISAGDLAARIIHQDKFGGLSPALSAVNRAFDFMCRVVSESKILQQVELVKMDELRKAQLTEVADFFEKQIIPALDFVSKTGF